MTREPTVHFDGLTSYRDVGGLLWPTRSPNAASWSPSPGAAVPMIVQPFELSTPDDALGVCILDGDCD